MTAMSAQIRRFSVVILCAFLLLMANVFYIQVIRRDALANDSRNVRSIYQEYAIERGQILVGDKAIAISKATDDGDELKYQREYPQGTRYAFVTGFYSPVFGRTLAERQFNDFMVGESPEQFADSLAQLLSADPKPGGSLVLTLDADTQAAAERALGRRKGAVVALDPSTGAVLALTSYPRYDPNRLTSHDQKKDRAAWDELLADKDKPMLARAVSELYPPGSTFKVVTAAAALESLNMSPDSPLENATSYTPPQTRASIKNFGGGTCLGNKQPITLAEALQVSCNTVFARLGNDLGGERLVDMAQRFGLNERPNAYQIKDPTVAISRIPEASELDKPAEAQSAIGQRDVRVSPLQMAEVAATVANEGKRMSPFVVSRVLAFDGSLVKEFKPVQANEPISTSTADQLKAMMVQVVEKGTGEAARIPGAVVGGKTGTAQRGEGQAPHAWFIGFGESGGKKIAVAVIIEAGGDLGSEATGGRLSAPVAKAVMQAYFGGGR
jgi:peptidoglycan glycosyltransferase